MEESNPHALLCGLLRLMCQNTKSDYASIAFNDEDDTSTLRLKAAGSYSEVASYDLSISEDACRSLCPTTYMVQVARTGRVS